MSKYHPLDVRHPSNRDLLRRNYLLDPPVAQADTKIAQSAPARTGSRPPPAASPQREVGQPAAPWGRRQPTTPPVAATTTPRRGGGVWWNAFIIGVFVVIFASQNDMLAGLLDHLRLLARQNGIVLPF